MGVSRLINVSGAGILSGTGIHPFHPGFFFRGGSSDDERAGGGSARIEATVEAYMRFAGTVVIRGSRRADVDCTRASDGRGEGRRIGVVAVTVSGSGNTMGKEGGGRADFGGGVI
jgi:hypothetical protein